MGGWQSQKRACVVPVQCLCVRRNKDGWRWREGDDDGWSAEMDGARPSEPGEWEGGCGAGGRGEVSRAGRRITKATTTAAVLFCL
jgi:hypothetical protein